MDTNAVVVIVDALRADRIGPYKGTTLTPHINQLMTEGLTFERAFTTTNATDSATTSLHTGLHPLSHGVINHAMRVTDEEKKRAESVTQFPEILQQAGIRTIHKGRHMGRWHYNGFDEVTTLQPHSQFWKLYEKYFRGLRNRNKALGKILDGMYWYTKKVITALEGESPDDLAELLDTLRPDEQFYSTLHLMDTHMPYSANEDVAAEYLQRFDYDGIKMEKLIEQQGDGPWLLDQRANLIEDDNNTPTIEEVKAWYDASVTHADEKIGRLIKELKERGMYDDTLLIVLSDHGESLDEHGIFFDHHGLYDQTVQIPLVVKPPHREKFDPGTTVKTFTQITDVAPTVLDYMNVGAEAGNFDGATLRPLIEGDDDGWTEREAILVEEAHTQRRRALRTYEHKYIQSLEDDLECRYCNVVHGAEEELYDLAEDPEELKNIVDENLEAREELSEITEALVASYELREATDDQSDVTYEDEDIVADRLEALGYK
ncbi:DUF229 domain-containing protein [Halorubrum sp. GN11_10-6_MGM]|uniref:sulfatase family protein n=1 Tax=Halorubrum sp. GN11_10-6_MGM TaxID=2518112 RepID=UPI0010F4C2B9|nr:sulfatase [Halorubrum sp. GN11_10-6_MGM]TKX72880.1 DUF229 domain-containing protein [Halorubrum sp. GN11_10-6_MGM]